MGDEKYRFGLTEKTIRTIQIVFAKYPQIERAILYGSRAKGNYRFNSDIDLTFDGEKLDFQLQAKIENELDDLLLPYKIDLSLLRTINDVALLASIRREGIVFYEKNTT